MSGAATGAATGAVSGAAAGAVAGSVIPVIGTGIGAALGGALGAAAGWFGGSSNDAAAEAAGEIAQQQLQLQVYNRNMAVQTADRGIEMSGWTLQELQDLGAKNNQLERTYWMQQAALSRDYSLLQSVDPALREAGNQAYGLMKGQEAAALAPIRAQRDMQKMQLQDKLQRQLGSGWQTSSAGIEAMSRFESETSSLMAQAQSQTLAQFLGVAQAVRPDMLKETNSAELTLQTLADSKVNLEQNVQNRQMNALNSRISAITGNNPAPYGGANQVSSLISAQNQANQIQGMTNTLYGLGGAAIAGGLGGRGAAATAGSAGGTLGSSGGGFNYTSTQPYSLVRG